MSTSTNEIEHVAYAERIGRDYKIWLKWRGYSELSYRWAKQLIKETSNAVLLDEIKKAQTAADAVHAARFGHINDDPDVQPATAGGGDTERSDAVATPPVLDERELRRQRRAAVLEAHKALLLDVDFHVSSVACDELFAVCAASDDYCLGSSLPE